MEREERREMEEEGTRVSRDVRMERRKDDQHNEERYVQNSLHTVLQRQHAEAEKTANVQWGDYANEPKMLDEAMKIVFHMIWEFVLEEVDVKTEA